MPSSQMGREPGPPVVHHSSYGRLMADLSQSRGPVGTCCTAPAKLLAAKAGQSPYRVWSGSKGCHSSLLVEGLSCKLSNCIFQEPFCCSCLGGTVAPLGPGPSLCAASPWRQWSLPKGRGRECGSWAVMNLRWLSQTRLACWQSKSKTTKQSWAKNPSSADSWHSNELCPSAAFCHPSSALFAAACAQSARCQPRC